MQGIFCPACGRDQLRRKSNGVLRCTAPECPHPDAAQRVLADPEIEHVVHFDPVSGHFNVLHPLRERVDGELLDCQIHGVVDAWVDPLPFKEHFALKGTTWRVFENAEGQWTKEPVL